MSLKETQRFRIPCEEWQSPRSLLWSGDDLVDRVGGTQFRLNGTIESGKACFGCPFDRAVSSKDGRYSVVYHALGTKGLILRDNKLVREVNRSFYHATTYEYPIALFELPDGRPVIAHCPQEYNKIEIEEIESGRTLTMREGKAADFFHSRLQVSPDGDHLLSAGWVWQPMDYVQLFPLKEVLKSPKLLDECAGIELPEEMWEANVAAFSGNDALLLVGGDGDESGKSFLARYNLKQGKLDMKSALQEPTGTIMPLGEEYLIGFYKHPKLFEIYSGKVIERWPELDSGTQISSIIRGIEKLPPLAFDSDRKRFAVGDKKGITVIQLG
jgi:hypothetical protein